MKQFNINITDDFEQDLSEYMRLTQIQVKVEAIRQAVKEATLRYSEKEKTTNFFSWIGSGLKAGLNENSKFSSEDDLW